MVSLPSRPFSSLQPGSDRESGKVSTTELRIQQSLVNPGQIKKDLVKTLIISLFAILSEGVLYWLWRAY
jgi:hypothetical protein